METTTEIEGSITTRRSMGKNLAFVNILGHRRQPRGDVDGKEESFSLVFCRNGAATASSTTTTMEKSSTNWDPFPVKASALPHGARVLCVVRPTSRVNNEGEPIGPPYEVVNWKMLEHPGQSAIVAAQKRSSTSSKEEIVSYTDYLRARGSKCIKHQLRKNQGAKSTHRDKKVRSPTAPPNVESHTGTSVSSSLRSKVFADFLAKNVLSPTDRVLDVAGGKGGLSIEIAVMSKLPCFVVDPVVRKQWLIRKQWPKRTAKRLRKADAPIPEIIPRAFEKATSAPSIIEETHCTCLIGLHADQPTEDIVDVALAHNFSVAVVPCCVFPSFFPMRVLAQSNKPVNTYEDFLQYLLEKDPRLKQAELPFAGKNKVIYYNSSSTS